VDSHISFQSSEEDLIYISQGFESLAVEWLVQDVSELYP
jgi:hypothetical protein